MTSISHQTSSSFHYVELKTVHSSPKIVSSSSSLLSSSFSSSSSDNEKIPICKVTNSVCMEKSSQKQQRRRKKKNHRDTIYLPSLRLPDFPVKTQCPSCNKFVETRVKYQNGTCVYIFAIGLFSLTVALFWVPFFMDSCKGKNLETKKK